MNDTLSSLHQIWRARDPKAWAADPENFRALGERILKIGEPLLAYDVLAEGEKYFPQDLRLRQSLALALARSGAAESANVILDGLYKEGHRDEETVGLLARTYKSFGNFQRAFEFYFAAYQSSGGYWSGINAATLALKLGNTRQAEDLAHDVLRKCREALKDAGPAIHDRYWILSTLGEASLVLRQWQESEDWYRQAAELGAGDWGSLQSTARNARLVLQSLGESPDAIDELFRLPSVVVFSGHMSDQPGRPEPRFPSGIEAAVKDAIRRRLKELNAGFGYASAARGSDILFHEALLEMNGECHVVLPHDRQLFIKESVGTDSNWTERFEKVLGEAAEVHEPSSRQVDPAAYEFTNRMLHGLAAIRAEQLQTGLTALAVWNGKPGDGAGGTATAVEEWRKAGMHVDIIDTEAFWQGGLKIADGNERGSYAVRSEEEPNFISEIRALLFADVEGFSKLTDQELPLFVRYFLGLIAKLLKESRADALLRNTWGDGLFFVFSNVREAGTFALKVIEAVRDMDWAEKGLPRLNLRVALHAGPVYRCEDPVTGRPNYIGADVNRAARIEPITPAGYVYASQPFAALAAAEGVKEFRCNYVGQTPMAKGYGTFPTYVVRQAQ